MSSFRLISDSAVNASTTAMKNARLPWGQVPQHHPVFGWQPEAQEAQHEQRADDVGLHDGEREDRPAGADDPVDKRPVAPDQPRQTRHSATVSVSADAVRASASRSWRFRARTVVDDEPGFHALLGQAAGTAHFCLLGIRKPSFGKTSSASTPVNSDRGSGPAAGARGRLCRPSGTPANVSAGAGRRELVGGGPSGRVGVAWGRSSRPGWCG